MQVSTEPPCHTMAGGEVCTGCGECVPYCTMGAIAVTERMTRLCICGVFNPERAADLVAAMAG